MALPIADRGWLRFARAADMLMIGSAASEAKQCTDGDAENAFDNGMTTFDV